MWWSQGHQCKAKMENNDVPLQTYWVWMLFHYINVEQKKLCEERMSQFGFPKSCHVSELEKKGRKLKDLWEVVWSYQDRTKMTQVVPSFKWSSEWFTRGKGDPFLVFQLCFKSANRCWKSPLSRLTCSGPYRKFVI